MAENNVVHIVAFTLPALNETGDKVNSLSRIPEAGARPLKTCLQAETKVWTGALEALIEQTDVVWCFGRVENIDDSLIRSLDGRYVCRVVTHRPFVERADRIQESMLHLQG